MGNYSSFDIIFVWIRISLFGIRQFSHKKYSFFKKWIKIRKKENKIEKKHFKKAWKSSCPDATYCSARSASVYGFHPDLLPAGKVGRRDPRRIAVQRSPFHNFVMHSDHRLRHTASGSLFPCTKVKRSGKLFSSPASDYQYMSHFRNFSLRKKEPFTLDKKRAGIFRRPVLGTLFKQNRFRKLRTASVRSCSAQRKKAIIQTASTDKRTPTMTGSAHPIHPQPP